MLFLKLALVAFGAACALAVFTVAWVVALTPGKFIVGQGKGATGVDIDLLVAMTVRSPLYWLLAIAIVAAAVWLARRWAFPG